MNDDWVAWRQEGVLKSDMLALAATSSGRRLLTVPHHAPRAPLSPPPNRSRCFNFAPSRLPCLAVWSAAGPGQRLEAGSLDALSSEEERAALVRKFVRDTWDQPAAEGSGWDEA
jgi:hypothetical protein